MYQIFQLGTNYKWMKQVLIVDKLHPEIINILENQNFICKYKPDITEEEVFDIIPNFHVLVIRSKFKIEQAFLNKALHLELICRVGSGLDNINISAAKEKNITCINTPEGNRDSVGEHAIGLLLSLLNKICISNNQLKEGVWKRDENWGTEIKGKTISTLIEIAWKALPFIISKPLLLKLLSIIIIFLDLY